jgi:hypothetical protein
MFGVLDDLAQSAGDFFSPGQPARPSAATAPAHTRHHGHGHGHPAAHHPQPTSVFEEVSSFVGGIGRDVGHAVAVDGVDALRDTRGMVDRIQSREELRHTLEVVPEDFHGRRLPNMVTAEEFERTAHVYSDIRLGRGDLTIDPARTAVVSSGNAANPTQTEVSQLPAGDERLDYERGVLDDIATVMQTPVGREEIGLLNSNPLHHHTTIAPHLRRKNHLDMDNGFTTPANIANATTPGVGSDTLINFNPGYNIFDNDGDRSANAWMQSMRSDVTMVHEMTHALFETLGQEDRGAVDRHDGVRLDAHYRDPKTRSHLPRAEHQAVGLGRSRHGRWGENRYRHQRRRMADSDYASDGTSNHDRDADMSRRTSYIGRPAR